MELDIVSQLKDFSTLSFQRKLEIINKDRPTPDLKNLHQTAGKNKIIRCIQRSWYAKKECLCGCSVKNRLFRFLCLLFATKSRVWKETGFCDLKNLSRSLCKHENFKNHIQSQITLKTFGNTRIDLALSEQQRFCITLHNSKVTEKSRNFKASNKSNVFSS